MSVSLFLFGRQAHLYHILDSIVSDIIWHLSFWFTSLGMKSPVASMLLQVALFHPLSWLSSIPLSIYLSHLLYSFICWWTFTLFPCLGYYKQCCCYTYILVTLLVIYSGWIARSGIIAHRQRYTNTLQTSLAHIFYTVDTVNTQGMSCCILILTYLVSIWVSLNVDLLEGRDKFIHFISPD